VIKLVPTNETVKTESQRYNCLIRNGGNIVPKYNCPEAKCSIPTTGLALFWTYNPFRGNSNYWQVSSDIIKYVNFYIRQKKFKHIEFSIHKMLVTF